MAIYHDNPTARLTTAVGLTIGPNPHLSRNISLSRNSMTYSLVPKERHVPKEGNGCTFGLCFGCKERHVSTFHQSIDTKEIHV